MLETGQTLMPSETAGTGICLVFTDTAGRVVFVDSNFLALIRQPDAGYLVGEPLHTVLGVPQALVRGLMKTIGSVGFVHEAMMTIKDASGQTVEVACSGVAGYDERGNPIGVDFTLRDILITPPAEPLVSHQDVVSSRIKQIEQEVIASAEQERQAFAQWYFTAQADALQVLLARMGGPHVRRSIEAEINQMAAENRWAVQLSSGHFMIGPGGAPDEAYRALLTRLIDYSVGLIGQRMVVKEMKIVDGQMSPHAQQIAGEAGLRHFVVTAAR